MPTQEQIEKRDKRAAEKEALLLAQTRDEEARKKDLKSAENKEKTKTEKIAKKEEVEKKSGVTKKEPLKEPASAKKEDEPVIPKAEAEKFKRHFNIDVQAIPAVKELSKEQLVLLSQSMQQVKLDLINKEAVRMEKERAQNSSVFQKTFNLTRKGYLRELDKKVAFEKVSRGGMALYGKHIETIANSLSHTGLSAVADSSLEGGLRIEYAHGIEGLTPAEKIKIDSFNKMATKFGSIPREWALDDAGMMEKIATGEMSSWNHKETFAKAKEEYEVQQKELTKMLEDKWGKDSEKITSYLRKIDNSILFNQVIAQDPKALEVLKEIQENKPNFLTWAGTAGKNTLKALTGQRAVFIVGGFLARGGAKIAEVASYAAFPIAGVLGGLREKLNKSKEIRNQKKMARHGIIGNNEVAQNLLANFRNISKSVTKEVRGEDGKIETIERDHGLTGRVELLVQMMEKNTAEIAGLESQVPGAELSEKEEILKKIEALKNKNIEAAQTLARRMDYIRQKIEAGTVNYGGDDERTVNQYRLASAMNHGYSLLAIESIKEDPALKEEFEKRLNSLFNNKIEGKIAETERILKRNAFWKGAAVGVVSAGIGFGVRSLWNYFDMSDKVSHLWHEFLKAKNVEPPQIAGGGNGNTPDFNNYYYQHPINPDDHLKVPYAPGHEPGTSHVSVEQPYEVKFSSQGLGKTIGAFKASPDFKNLPHEVQEFFKGKDMKIAEKLHGYMPKANASVTVGPNSQFGFNEKGEIFLTDTHHPNQVHILGKMEDGKIKIPEKSNLEYIHAKHDEMLSAKKPVAPHIRGDYENTPSHAPTAPHISGEDTVTHPGDLATTAPRAPKIAPENIFHDGDTVPKGTEAAAPAPHNTPEGTTGQAPHEEAAPKNVESPKTDAPKIPETAVEIAAKADGETKEVLHSVFSKLTSGNENSVWTYVKEDPAADFLKVTHEDLIANVKTNLDAKTDLWAYMRALQTNTRTSPKVNEKIGEYIERAGKEYLYQKPDGDLKEVLKTARTALENKTL